MRRELEARRQLEEGKSHRVVRASSDREGLRRSASRDPDDASAIARHGAPCGNYLGRDGPKFVGVVADLRGALGRQHQPARGEGGVRGARPPARPRDGAGGGAQGGRRRRGGAAVQADRPLQHRQPAGRRAEADHLRAPGALARDEPGAALRPLEVGVPEGRDRAREALPRGDPVARRVLRLAGHHERAEGGGGLHRGARRPPGVALGHLPHRRRVGGRQGADAAPGARAARRGARARAAVPALLGGHHAAQRHARALLSR